MKTYLHRPIKTLQFLTPMITQKCLRPTLYCTIFAELNLIELSLTKMRHLRDPNKFQFIHKILLVRLKRILSKTKQQERLSDNSLFTHFTRNYKIRISNIILN